MIVKTFYSNITQLSGQKNNHLLLQEKINVIVVIVIIHNIPTTREQNKHDIIKIKIEG